MEYCLNNKQKVIGVLVLSSASLSTVLLVLALAGEHWVTCLEAYKGGAIPLEILDKIGERALYMKSTFGAWRSCSHMTDANGTAVEEFPQGVVCKRITYIDDNDEIPELPEDENSEEGDQKNTEGDKDTILAAITQSMKMVSIFAVLGLVIKLAADISCVFGCKYTDRKALMFLTGVVFVFSGLILLASIIIFMGAVTGESAHQPAVAKDEIPIFRYWYGYSFALLTMAFALDETAGVLSVYLFIIRYKESFRRRQARLHVLKSSDLLNNYLARRRRSHMPSTDHSGPASRRTSHIPPSETEQSLLPRDQSRYTLNPATNISINTNFSICNIERHLVEGPVDDSENPVDLEAANFPEGFGVTTGLLTTMPALTHPPHPPNGSVPSSPLAPPFGFGETIEMTELSRESLPAPPAEWSSSLIRNGSVPHPPDVSCHQQSDTSHHKQSGTSCGDNCQVSGQERSDISPEQSNADIIHQDSQQSIYIPPGVAPPPYGWDNTETSVQTFV